MSSETTEVTDLAARVSELERQVAALQHRDRHDCGDGAWDTAVDTEKFWALNGLKARAAGAGAVLFTGSVSVDDEPVEWQQGVSADSLLEADWTVASETLAALGQPVRLILLQQVLRGTHSAAELGELDGVGTSGQLYHHLRQLVSAGWLRTVGRGRYEVPTTRVVPLLVVMAAAQR